MSAPPLLLTGAPGVGKTTLCRQLIQSRPNAPIGGFISEEVRDAQTGRRIGFDLVGVGIDSYRYPLARRRQAAASTSNRIGPYTADIDSLDKVAATLHARQHDDVQLLFVDEIGKMELLSTQFRQAVQRLIDNRERRVVVVATIPLIGGGALVERLRRCSAPEDIFTLTAETRRSVADRIDARIKSL